MHNVIIPTELVGQKFRAEEYKFHNRIITENEDKNKGISNDCFWKSNQYIGEDNIGRKLDLTSIIDRPDSYLQGKLSEKGDVDYYMFDTLWYKGLSIVDKYNVNMTVTLDHIPDGCNYDLILYDENGNQVGIGTDNGKGGKSVNVPNWNMNNKQYTVKVQAKDGSSVNKDEYYHLSFQTDAASKEHGAYIQMQETKEYMFSFRKKLYEGQDTTEEKQALEEIRKKYDAYYMEQMEKLHENQAKECLKENSDGSEFNVDELLS